MSIQEYLGAMPQVPVVIKRGGVFNVPFVCVDPNGDVISLDGYNARMQIWGSLTASGTALLDIGTYGTNTTYGTIAIDRSTWQVTITILPAATAGLANILAKGCYEFHFFDSGNVDIPFFEGPVIFEPGGIR